MRAFAVSRYQSQYLCQIKSYKRFAASLNLYKASALFTSSSVVYRLLSIHLSAKGRFPFFYKTHKSVSTFSDRFVMTNLDAFHILFAKFLPR